MSNYSKYELGILYFVTSELLLDLHDQLDDVKNVINDIKTSLPDLKLDSNEFLEFSDKTIRLLDTGLMLVYNQLVKEPQAKENPTDEPVGEEDNSEGVSPTGSASVEV